MDCAGGLQTGESIEQTEKQERLAGSDHSRCFESFAPECLEKTGEIVVDNVCDAKSIGLCVAHVTPTSSIRERADCVCAEDACGCWLVLVVASCRIVERMAERNGGCTTGREEGVRSRGPSSNLQGNETTKREPVLDGTDCCDLEWKLYESALGYGTVEQNTDKPWIAPGRTRVSSHLHNDHGTGVARFVKKLDSLETGMETGRLRAGCDLLCGRCGVDCCIDVCLLPK